MEQHSIFYLALAAGVAAITYVLIDLVRLTLAWLNGNGIPTSWIVFGLVVCALSVTLLAWAQTVKHD